MSTVPKGLTYLTPEYFSVGMALASLSEPDMSSIERWKLVPKFMEMGVFSLSLPNFNNELSGRKENQS